MLEPVWTKVLSKDDWATILLSMTRRSLEGLAGPLWLVGGIFRRDAVVADALNEDERLVVA